MWGEIIMECTCKEKSKIRTEEDKRKLLNRFVITETNKINFKEKLLKVIYKNFEHI